MRQRRGMEIGHHLPPENADDLFYTAKAFEYSRVLAVANDINIFSELSS